MSHLANTALREHFLELCECIMLCPYCMEPYGGAESGRACCGEVHEELGYIAPNGEYFLESETEEHFATWLSERKEGTNE